jgi:hypothetical protein
MNFGQVFRRGPLHYGRGDNLHARRRLPSGVPLAGTRFVGALLAYFLLVYALDRVPPSSKSVTLALVVGVWAMVLAACCLRRLPRVSHAAGFWVLSALLSWEMWSLLARPVSPMPATGWDNLSRMAQQWSRTEGVKELAFLPGAFSLAVLVLACVALTYGWTNMPGGRWRLRGILSIYFFLGAWMIVNTPRPVIDVWWLQQGACEVLLEGKNPYSAEYPFDRGQLAPEIRNIPKVQSFPYPPLSLLAVLPGYALGDVRWSLLAAMLGSAALMAATGRRLGLPPGHAAELIALAYLCHPRGLMVIRNAWTEPLLTFAATAGIWATAARRDKLFGLSLAGLATVKQTGVLSVPAMWRSTSSLWRTAIPAGAGAMGLILPFFLSDPAGFWKGVVTTHLLGPLRLDSLSVPAIVAASTGYELPPVLAFVAAGVVAWLVLRQKRLSLSERALGSAAILLGFFLFNKTAHMNYYWWAGSFLPLAAIAAAGESNEEASSAG